MIGFVIRIGVSVIQLAQRFKQPPLRLNLMVILILQTQKVEANVTCELPTSILARDCIDLLEQGFKKDGVYHINPDDRGSFHVFCDQTTNGGGWIVFQKRFNGSEDFHRNLSDYKNGFGNLNGEFWLGNDRIHRLTDRHHQLLVELDGFNNIIGYAQYETFSVDSEENGYKIHLGPYSGQSVIKAREYGIKSCKIQNTEKFIFLQF